MMSVREAPSSRFRRALPWVALFLGIFGFIYACLGMVMAGSFSVAAPEAAERWWWVALGYEIAAGASLLLSTGAVAVLVRRARRPRLPG